MPRIVVNVHLEPTQKVEKGAKEKRKCLVLRILECRIHGTKGNEVFDDVLKDR